MRASPTELGEALASRGLIAVVPIAAAGEAPSAVVLQAPGDAAIHCPLDDERMRQTMAAWMRRADHVYCFEQAHQALRALLALDIDVRRPLCRHTLHALIGHHPTEVHSFAHDVTHGAQRAEALLDEIAPLLRQVAERGARAVARLENLVLRPFAAMEQRGLYLDVMQWRALVQEAQAEVDVAKKQTYAALGDAVGRDLFGEPDLSLEADVEVKAVLERLLRAELPDVSKRTLGAIEHPAAQALLRYREAYKIVSTYGEAFLEHVEADGRVRASFIPMGASTGRISCRDPNLQNLPSDEGFHRAVCAPPGRALVTADYATCELRILAELSGDPRFLEAFAKGDDLHSVVASQVFGVPVSKTENAPLRKQAKAINFGLCYGMGAQAFAAQIGQSKEQAQTLLDRYFATFPRIKRTLEGLVDEALERGYAKTLLGRRLYFDPEVLEQKNARGELSRIAKNMPIQGTSADMTKLAMVRVHERLTRDFHDAGLVNTVHDELVVECDEGDAHAVGDAVRDEMEQAHLTLVPHVPPLVDVSVGPYWSH